MKFKFIGRDFETTEAMEATIKEKLSFLSKFIGPEEVIDITLSKEGDTLKSITVLTVFEGEVVKISEIHKDLYSGLDILKDRLKNELSQKKESKIRRERLAAASIKAPSSSQDILGDRAEEIEGEIVKEKVFHLKPMYIEEAIEQMNMLGHSFFVYMDGDSGETNVLYRRKDGNYGVIRTELA